MTRRVTIVQELLPHYRVPLFERLREELACRGVEVELIHGFAHGNRAAQRDEGTLPWARVVRNTRIGHSTSPILWQSAFRFTRESDLIVVEHANRLALNCAVALRQALGGPRMAYWGHGGNLQSTNPAGARERLKRATMRWPHWWFAYTQGSAERVARSGFPRARITVLNNTVNTDGFGLVPERERQQWRCVFVGSLHEYKRIPFLLEAGQRISEILPPFHLEVVGDGPLRHLVERRAATSSWLTYRGSLFGADKVRAIETASLQLMPGLVGLGAVESFAARTPMVTIDLPYHSPEFEYLKSGLNSLVLPSKSTPAEYAAATAGALGDVSLLKRLREGCSESALTYSLDGLVSKFAAGILSALELTIQP